MADESFPNKYQQQEGIKLGLSHEQVSISNFGAHTINAIKAELNKGVSLKTAFVKYRELKYIQIEAMITLGLSREHVSIANFGYHTVNAIKAELNKGVSLETAFVKYHELEHIQIEAMTTLGLNREHVSIANFGYHTVNAIKAELNKGVSLETAFIKYCELEDVQIVAMTTLGLSREHVLTANFDDHTVNAIRDIQKRTKDLSSVEAFKMVEGKSDSDTQKFLSTYLTDTRKAQKPISKMTLIRVIVNPARGFGHQRAAITLMQKLRELGFKGTFDIQCDDRLGARLFDTATGKMYRNDVPLVSRQLISMIPGFALTKSSEDRVAKVPGLGAIKISSLPHNNGGLLKLSKAELAVCAADDRVIQHEDMKAITFNATSYIGLEPTDWYQGSCFVTDQDGIVTKLPPASTMRLSSATYQLPNLSSITLSVTEQRIIDITNNTEISSQLVYGLYPAMCYDLHSGSREETENLDEATEMQRIVDANLLLSRKIGKPSIIFVPQTIALDSNFIRTVTGRNDKIHFVDLTKSNLNIGAYKADDVVIAHTGHLQQTVFDHLMLQGTTLPPVIEGCNSRELCESAGRPFIHGSDENNPLIQYELEAGDKQALHTQASLCLEQGDRDLVPQLVQYMEESLTANPALLAYHMQRREAFLKRPDACELALDTLGIQYKKEPQKPGMFTQFGALFFSGPGYEKHEAIKPNKAPSLK